MSQATTGHIVDNVSRRTVVKAALGVTGGLILGLPAGCSPAETPLNTDPVQLNTYVLINEAGDVVIYTPTAEMGQGNYTALTKIIADELEADWDRVSVRLSHADDAFANPQSGRQRTANSEAVVGYYQLLREVGASARDMLIRAAAADWGVDPSECTASNSKIIHGPSDRSVDFGGVVTAAAKLEPPEAPPLKSPDQFKLIGKSTPRKDTPLKVDGSAEYGIDVQQPDMLVAAIKHVPVFGASVTSHNGDEIMNSPGVHAVVEVSSLKTPNAAVAVVADTFWQAKTAADQLVLEWDDPDAGRVSSESVAQQLSAALDDDDNVTMFPNADFSQMPPKISMPDPEAANVAIANADLQLDATYEVPFLAHACMEPLCSTALVTDERCEIWTPHQQPDKAMLLAEEITGLSKENIRLNRTFLGGGFGRKWVLDFFGQSVEIAKAVKGRPVKLIWTREEDIKHCHFRPAYAARTRAGMTASGEIQAMHSRIAGQSLWRFYDRAFIPGMGDPTVPSLLIYDAYDKGQQWIDWAETTSPVPIGYWRGVTLSQNAFFAESAIDELAHLAGQDPYEFRRGLLNSDRYRAVLDLAAEKSNWSEPLGPGRGRGIAMSYAAGACCVQVVEVTVDEKDVKVDRVVAAFDCGMQVDPAAIVAQIESGVIFGVNAALTGQVTIEDGEVIESNFHDHPLMSLEGLPDIEVHLLPSDNAPAGVGEAGVPAALPAVTNAIFAATGDRIRKLPVVAHDYNVSI